MASWATTTSRATIPTCPNATRTRSTCSAAPAPAAPPPRPRNSPPPTPSSPANTGRAPSRTSIGQEAMVRTLTNAFATGRIAHAFMLTGVRGVGKTTTARLLARALNNETDTIDRPSLDLTADGRHDAAIMAGQHMDVMEMDAASPHRRRRHPRHAGERPLRPGRGALQGLRPRRSAHAVEPGVQRPAEDAGRAAAARQVHLRHHRDPQGAGDHPVAAASGSTCAGSSRTSWSSTSTRIAEREGMRVEAEAPWP